ncbi:MAG TPA: hypothetical protein VFM57_01040 [Thermoleophilaceae bacterium]|nr:hypothetical protein [Thermoleophilaceae bacterium]
MLPIQQWANDAPEPARVVGSAALLDDVQAMLSGQARREWEHAGGRPVVTGTDQQGVEPTEADELAELLTASVRDDDLLEIDPCGLQEQVGVAQQTLGSSGARRPRPRLVRDRYQERHAKRRISRVPAADPHQAMRIDVRVGRDERAVESGWAGGLFEFHCGPRSVLSVEALSAEGASVLTR